MTAQTRTYGGWTLPGSPGLPGLGFVGTVLALGTLVVAVLVQTVAGLAAALVVLLAGAVLVAPIAYRDASGRNGWAIATTAVLWTLGRYRGQDVYLAPLATPLAFGGHQLPGLLAPSRLVELHGIGLVLLPAARHVTVLLRLEPEGGDLVDRDVIDQRVAWWGKWLADLGSEPGLVAASVTVQSAPDDGVRLRREVDGLLVDTAPTLAREVLEHAARTYPAAAASTTAHLALTYTARRPRTTERELLRRGHRAPALRSPEEMAQLIASRLPGLVRGLSATGAGTAVPMTAADVAGHVRAAYDPAVSRHLEEARAAGEEGAAVSWEQAGPAAMVERWDSLTHDSAVSATFTMAEAPRGVVDSGVFADLLAAAPDVLCRRVTITYRPHSAADAAAIADRDVRVAHGKTGVRAGGDQARVTAAAAAAEQAAREEAAGAGLVRFSMLVTVTTTAERLDEAADTVDQHGRASRVRLRRAYGAQSAAFAAGLGVGVVLPDHVAVPALLREGSL